MSKDKTINEIYYKDKVIVLTYHDIDPNGNMYSAYNISPKQFANHLDKLLENGFYIVNMDQFIQFVLKDGTIPPNAVLLTFDDGNKSFYDYAFPELKKRSIPATNFVVVKLIDSSRCLSWDNMLEMKQFNLNFYSHTYNHHRNTNYGENKRLLTNFLFLEAENRLESEAEYRNRIKKDLILAQSILAGKLGEQPKLLCFPYGAYNETVVEVGKEIGIQLYFTVQKGINSRNQFLINRINAGDNRISANKLIEEIMNYCPK
ncbi:polysaccharide deacetylase family protein [Bacillus salitolerans]|uniref:Polysaccharide deacetylase family protein n=1 Tax=Bacillus salitolerans TaxID=1437434 RepID=A0ABW4LK25_9BACI